MAAGGRLVVVGNPSSDMTLTMDQYWKILRNQLTVTGTWNSSFTHDKKDDWHYALDRISAGRIAPERFITQKFEFEELDRGVLMMRDKTREYVKVMVVR